MELDVGSGLSLVIVLLSCPDAPNGVEEVTPGLLARLVVIAAFAAGPTIPVVEVSNAVEDGPVVDTERKGITSEVVEGTKSKVPGPMSTGGERDGARVASLVGVPEVGSSVGGA